MALQTACASRPPCSVILSPQAKNLVFSALARNLFLPYRPPSCVILSLAREPGEDAGKHGQPVQLRRPTDRCGRIAEDALYAEPSVATEDTAPP